MMATIVSDTPSALSAASIKLSDVVYNEISSWISRGRYAGNARLPTENDLADQLAVSRPVVREALSRLRNEGVIVSRRGSGSYVRTRSASPVSNNGLLVSIHDLRQFIDFRISLEGETAFHAARGRPEDRQALDRSMAQLTATISSDQPDLEDDFHFHAALAEATGNRFFTAATSNLRETMLSVMRLTTSFAPPEPKARREALLREHIAIYEAVREGRDEAARAAMQTHLKNAKSRIFDGATY
jgi:GntR family transcriptional regulator, transcriptional repressor for pyruvate dehydrogenase complex